MRLSDYYNLFYFFQGLLKYTPFKIGIYLRRIIYRPFFNSFGKGVIIHDNVLFKFPSEMSIGNNVQIAQNTIFVGKGGLKIGNDVMIGAGTKIITSTHNYGRKDISMRVQGLSFRPVCINEDVWFGFNVIVLGGVNIGKGSIIGANSVVNMDIESYSIAAGLPAKIISKR
jgi:acetyltransferase-like isoleucine patch superfamily enzyme